MEGDLIKTEFKSLLIFFLQKELKERRREKGKILCIFIST